MRMKKCRSIGLLVLAVVLIFSSWSPLFDGQAYAADEGPDEFDQLREKWRRYLTGGTDYDPADPDITNYIENIVGDVANEQGTGLQQTMNKSGDHDFLWDDLEDASANASHISTSYVRLKTMALAYSIEGSALYQNEALKQDIIYGLNWMYDNQYNESTTQYGNWWYWEIGGPKRLKDLLVLMYEDLTTEQLNNYIATLDYFVGDPTTFQSGSEMTGANLMEQALAAAVRGIVGKNGEQIGMARDALTGLFEYVTSGDGFYEDGSFIQHRDLAYTGSYGIVLLDYLSEALYLLQGSSWEITDPNVNNVYMWAFESFQPLIYKGAMMDMVRGRAISRHDNSSHNHGRRVGTALLLLSEVSPPEKSSQLKSMVKHWIVENDTFNNYYQGLVINDIVMMKALMADEAIEPRGELIGHYTYSAMDRIVHRRPGWTLGISMYSERIQNYEISNNENAKGWYTGSGMTYLYNGDLTQYSDNYWPTVDSLRLPGTTTDLEPKPTTTSSENWVGGTSVDGLYGVAGMAFDYEEGTLEGKKSWFMFDDEVVALGAGITSDNGREIETIVENRTLNESGNNSFTVNGDIRSSELGWSDTMEDVEWAHLEGNVPNADIGYYFPETSDVFALRESRTGTWTDINPGRPKNTLLSNNYLTLSHQHVTNPDHASYSYVLLPGKNVSETEQYSEDADIEILRNTDALQAVEEKALGLTAVNFWEASSLDFITAHDPASVILKEEGQTLTLSVSDPTHDQETVTIELHKKGLSVESKDSSVEVLQTAPSLKIEVDVAGSLGQTHTLTLKQDSDGGDSDDKAESVNDLKTLVEQFEEAGAFSSDGAARALKLHLTAVHQFEQQEATDKVVKHMNGFNQLLHHQKENELISEQAYDTLKENADALIEKWGFLVIARNGQTHAVVVIAEDADEQEQKAADTLVEYVRKSTGAILSVMTEAQLHAGEGNYDDYVKLYIGDIAGDAHIDKGLENLNDQGFLIHPHGNRLSIVGPTVWGTLNGVYDFLERYVGVAWLMPGPKGEDVPQLTELLVPKDDVRDEPVFNFRNISPANGRPESNATEPRRLLYEWAQRNRLQGNYNRPIEFHHNLHALFPPEKYAESNPEFYPGGNPPAPGEEAKWQPCFTVDGTVDAAVSGIIEYFDENPDAKSFSLGVNDTGGYCEEDPSHPHYPGKKNSINLVDMSDIYYQWVNDVVEQVLEVYPDKWFGLLAYQNVMDPPSFPLNPRVVPFITKDRLAWVDGGVRSKGHQQIEAWNEVASQIGWYDYMYGVQYNIPRIYPHLMAENYRYATDHQVFGHYAEMYHNAADGPKAWLSAKLQWNPDQDVDKLLQEWYEQAVGPEAAPDLAAFYDLWEQIWMERIPNSDWFNTGKNDTYLPFVIQTYLNEVTSEDIAESKRLLASVVDKAETDQQKARAEILQRAFEFHETSVLSYPRKYEQPENETEALALLDELESNIGERIQMAQQRFALIEEFEKEPLLAFIGSPRGDWTGWNPYDFTYLRAYLDEHEPNGGPVTDRVHKLANDSESAHMRNFAQLLQEANLGNPLTDNPSFEEGNEDAPPWNFWNPKVTANIKRVEGTAHTGKASLLLEGAVRGGAYQRLDIKPGLTAAQVHYYTPPGTETDGTIMMVIEVFDDSGQKLATYTSDPVRFSETVGEWAAVGLLEDIPAKVDGKDVSRILVNARIDNAEDAQVYEDDLVVYQNASTELSDVTKGPLVAGEPVQATSSKDATLYLVPDMTEATKKAIEEAASAEGSSTTVVGGEAGTLDTTGLATDLYRVYAIDQVGNITPASDGTVILDTQMERVDDGDAIVNFSGSWVLVENDADIEGTMRRSKVRGDDVIIPFYGSAAKVIGVMSPNFGKATIYLDSEQVDTVDYYNEKALRQQVIYETGELEEGVHLLRIEVSGEKHPDSNSTHVSFDALEVQ